MVIVHEDNGCYGLSENTPTINKKLLDFYHLKFKKTLKSNNIPYVVMDYEDYGDDLVGNYFVGRFAQNLDDMKLHSKYFDKLYEYYGENMWPNQKAYYYYDDKVRQYELLEKYGICVPSITCNDLEELLKNVTTGTVIKSTYGAGSDSTFYVWKKEHLDNIEGYISNSYNSEDFFPCQVQEYIDVEYEYKIVITHDEIYGNKYKLLKEWNRPNDFPFNYGGEHWAERVVQENTGNQILNLSLIPDEFDSKVLESIMDIKRELNTPNLKFDILDNKVLEFTYIYGELQITDWKYYSFDLESKSFDKKVVSFNDFAYKQSNSVLKHLGIIK
jgi:hypothetical protein